MSDRRRQRGVVLATVLLLLLALTLLAHGSLLVARSFRSGASEGWEAVRVRRAVVSRVDAAAIRGDTLARGWRATGAGSDTRIDPLRLSSELVLLLGNGRDGVARWRAGRAVWHADPAARAAAASAAVRSGGGLSVDPGAPGVTVVPRSTCAAHPPLRTVAPLEPSGLRVGPLALVDLTQRLAPWRGAASSGGCPAGGCVPVAAVSMAPTRIDAGIVEGLLLVRGSLVLAGSARVVGQLLVDGDLTLLEGAVVEGTVQVTGHVRLSGAGSVSGDPCVVERIWRSGVATLIGPVALGRRAWPLWGPTP